MHFCNPAQEEVLWFEFGLPGRKASVSRYVSRLESRPSFSFQAQTPQRGHYHLANRPWQSASRSLAPRNCPSKSASPKTYFPGHRPEQVLFSLSKVKTFPLHRESPSPLGFQTHVLLLQPVLTLYSWVKGISSSSTFPFIPTWLFISRISLFLNPPDYPMPHF